MASYHRRRASYNARDVSAIADVEDLS